MKKIAVMGLLVFALAGCANATRTVPEIVVEDRPMPSFVYEHPRLVVPPDRTYLPPPREPAFGRRPEVESVPLPPSRPYYTNPQHISEKSRSIAVSLTRLKIA